MITNIEVAGIYQKAFKVSWWQSLFGLVKICLADQQYEDFDLSVAQQVLTKDEIQKMKYEAEQFDCDDFAFALMGAFHHDRRTAAMPIFITWVSMPQGGHAVLSVITKYKEVLIIEPQNDKIYPVPDDWNLMVLCG